MPQPQGANAVGGRELGELELAYSCSQWSRPGRTADQVIGDFVVGQRECHQANLKSHPHLLNVAYGPQRYCDLWASSKELLEIEKGEGQVNGAVGTVFVYFHGGYWQEGDRTQGSSLVPSLLSNTDRQLVFASVGYDYATSRDRKVTELITEYAIKAVEYLSRRFPLAEVVLCGHSAGAHLAAKAFELMGASEASPQRLVKRVKKLICLCGVYDLNELVETYIGRAIGLTRADAASASLNCASLGQQLPQGGVLLLLAEWDAPKIREQNETLFEQVKGRVQAVEMKTILGVDHFSLVAGFQNVHSEQSRAVMEFISR